MFCTKCRYFFSSFLQLQLFESLCRIEFGEGVDLHRCDLYGAKRAGEKFRQENRASIFPFN